MSATLPQETSERRPRRWWRWLLLPPALMVATVGAVSWWLTAPMADHVVPVVSTDLVSLDTSREVVVPAPAEIVWPTERLEGARAKRLLLDALLLAEARIGEIDCYTATFRKQERLRGKLGPEQTLEMKVRQHPFALYLKFLAPQEGREVVYAEGHHDNKVIAHSGGLSRLLVPRLAVAPDHPIALADSRHAVTEAGIAKLTARLIGFRRMDLGDDDAVTILDRVTDAKGRARYRSIHTHAFHDPKRPFARVEVLYDPETLFPVDIMSYDWPTEGHQGPLLLAEHYSYENLRLDASLTALDFDPANPAYAFHRY